MADWKLYLVDDDVKKDNQTQITEAENRKLYYKCSDYVLSGPRKVVRFHFCTKGGELMGIPKWEHLCQLFRLGALTEKRNSKKVFETFEKEASKISEPMPNSVEECDAEIENIIHPEEEVEME
jgi:hypothetical protein